MSSVSSDIQKFLKSSEENRDIYAEELELTDEYLFDFGDDDISEGELMHYGMPRRSGRYPYGSGEDPYQHSSDFLGRVEELKKKNFSFTDADGKTWTGDTAIAKSMGLTTTQYRTQYQLARHERRQLLADRARSLRDDGLSLDAIAKEMGFKNDSSVRSLLDEKTKARKNQAMATADIIRSEIQKKGMIDVGAGVERELGVSAEKLKEALYILKEEGYPLYGGRIPQITNPDKSTTLKVICPPGTEHKEIFQYDKINTITDYKSLDKGDTFGPAFQRPSSLDSNRIAVKYAEEGGTAKDGVIEIRPGVADLSLRGAKYAQVRIMVDDTHFIKGMAVYSNNVPEGKDILINSNKHVGTPLLGENNEQSVLKNIKKDPDNPFGALLRQEDGQGYYTDPKTGEQKLSPINKTRHEGDWGEWAKELPSQFLAKQNQSLIDKQLKISKDDAKLEFDEIMELTNPTVKKQLLETFAETCDKKAVDLKAAALPRQKYQVLLPVDSLKDNEVYAPNYENGEQVALIRFPHAGTFEIPILTVNNKQKEGSEIIGKTAKDAVGVNSNVASRLSGADFDGDTVLVIPTGKNAKIRSTEALEGLKNFDPTMEYGGREKGTYKVMTSEEKGKQMGIVSNLITDMTIKGASPDELARAVRHSMVVIDAEKHELDYKASEKDNGIAELKKKYQGHYDENGKYKEGASTLISMAKSPVRQLKTKGTPKINPDTGELEYQYVEETYIDKKGKEQVRTKEVPRMSTVKDARTLSSGSLQEEAYADYANYMKDLANQARKASLNTGKIATNMTAKKTYADEVKSLNAKLQTAQLNAPRERQAQILANTIVKSKKQMDPSLSKKDIQKLSQKALTEARNKVGAKRYAIEFSDKEWEAIQSGAISANFLSKMLKYTDSTVLKEKATPRAKTQLTSAKIGQISSLSSNGYTVSEIARKLGVSTSTVSKYL